MDAHLLANQVYVDTCTKFRLYDMKENDLFYCNDNVHPIQPVLRLAADMILNHVLN